MRKTCTTRLSLSSGSYDLPGGKAGDRKEDGSSSRRGRKKRKGRKEIRSTRKKERKDEILISQQLQKVSNIHFGKNREKKKRRCAEKETTGRKKASRLHGHKIGDAPRGGKRNERKRESSGRRPSKGERSTIIARGMKKEKTTRSRLRY